MNKKNSLYEKRVRILENILKGKIGHIEKNNNISSDVTLEAIKLNVIKNKILQENEINNKIAKIKDSLQGLLEITNSEGIFFKYNHQNEEKIKKVEGHPLTDGISINILFKSDEILISEVTRKKNTTEPFHQNHDHQTISILIKGKLRLKIDDEVFIAEKGDLWVQKPNSYHSSEALSDSSEISIKFPPIKTW